MVQVVYVGPHDEVDVPFGSTEEFHVVNGVPVDVPDELAGRAPSGDDPGAGLLAQDDTWKPVSSSAPAAPVPTPEPAPADEPVQEGDAK